MRCTVLPAILLATSFSVAEDVTAWDWSPLPADARLTLFLTGSDFGRIVPRGCHHGRGGALYRPILGRLLAGERPDLSPLWLSVGNFAPVRDDGESVRDAREMFALFAMAGYGASGVSRHDLDRIPASGLSGLAEQFDIPLVATNIVLLETGQPAFRESVVLEAAGRRVAVVSAMEHRPASAWGDAFSGTLVTVEPAPAVERALAAVPGDVDLVVLLTTMEPVALRALLAAVPAIDVVASGWAAHARPAPERVGKAEILWLGNDGLHLGRVSLDAAGRRLETTSSAIRPPFPIDPLTGKRVAPPPGAGRGP